MALNFPNPSRIYDASRHCVCFWGYDNAREVTFQVSDDVLAHLSKETTSEEAAFLSTFDQHREQILLLARELYTPGMRNTYTIT